jgi:uncharacterized membrane protein HdeD (DUF308 family)
VSPAPESAALADERALLQNNRWLLFALGLVSVIVGFVAVSSAVVTTLASVVVFGVLLLIAGFTEVIHAVLVRNGKGFALHLLTAAFYLLVGLFVLEDPFRAAAVLTLLLAAYFFVGGCLRIAFSIVVRFPAWPWVLFNGAIELVLGAIILSDWRESSLRVIGVLVGIDVLLHGWSWMTLALFAPTFSASQPASPGP